MFLPLLLAADPAIAQQLAKDVVWVSRPSGKDIALAYPDAAMRQQLIGRSILNCSMTAQGRLANCQAGDEDPVSIGFAEAALKLAPKFVAKPQDAHGVPVDGRPIRIPIRFVLPAFTTLPEVTVTADGVLPGHANLNCRVTLQATLDSCYVSGASDQSQNAAALKVADQANAGAQPLAQPRTGYMRVQVPILFKAP